MNSLQKLVRRTAQRFCGHDQRELETLLRNVRVEAAKGARLAEKLERRKSPDEIRKGARPSTDPGEPPPKTRLEIRRGHPSTDPSGPPASPPPPPIKRG